MITIPWWGLAGLITLSTVFGGVVALITMNAVINKLAGRR